MIATTNTNNTTEDIYQLNSLDSRLSIEDKKLTLLLTNILLQSAEYTFTLPQNVILDDMDTGNEEVILSFTTLDNIILDSSLLRINTTNWYETKDNLDVFTNDGSFDQIITLSYPTAPTEVSNNDSLTGVFDTDLMDKIGNPTSPVTISGLPDGLKLRLSKQVGGNEGIQLRLTGKATSHQKRIDNTSLKVTFLEDFFTLSKHYEYTSNDISFDFDIIFGSSIWKERTYHQVLTYDDKLWILGGGIYRNDIWNSADGGTNWSQITVNGTHWSGRSLHVAFAYEDKLWVMGGLSLTEGPLNDIWNSADGGINWSKINVTGSHWDPLWSHQAFGYDNKLWVIGGDGHNDIWNSADEGTNWSKINVTGTHWTMQYGIQAFAYDDKLWVLGGSTENNASSRTNEIWSSSDGGTNWSQIMVNGPHWSARSQHQAFAYDDKLWVMGGKGTDGNSKNDIWTSADGGTNWSAVGVQGTWWSKRTIFQALSYDNKLWVLGGLTDHQENDVWYSADDGVTWTEIDPFY